MALTLHTFAGDFRAYKAQIAAQYNGVALKVVDLVMGKDNVKPEFIAKSPLGKVPLLETPAGAVFESNAIARYIARIRRDTELTGKSFFETSQVDAWMDFASHEVELPATLWTYPVLGLSEFREDVYAKAKADLHKALAVLEKHLLPRTFVVGESITLADITLVAALFYPFKLVIDEEAREAYPSVTRWFVTCVNQTAFAKVLGEVALATTELKAGEGAGAAAAGGKKADKKAEKKEKAAAGGEAKPKAEEKPKAEKAKKKKDDEDDDGGDDMAAFAEPKKVDPFAHLPPTPLVLDEWKRTYSNSRPDYYASMAWFWEKLDREGWTLWKQEYKYNDENKIDWQTSNLVSGFLQRCDEIRKYAFGSMVVLGESAPFEVSGVWVIRGKEIKQMLESNPDAEYHSWTALNPEDEATRKMVADYWCAMEEINGKKIYDSKIFK